MTPVAELLSPLMHSPLLPEVVLEFQQLAATLRRERALRDKFYEEMTPEMKVEFINGEVLLHSPARNRHLGATGHIFKLLAAYVDECELGSVKIEKCLVVFPRNDYEPDVVFFGREKAAALLPNTMKFPIPDLVVEVLSESTEVRDRGIKRVDYEAHGVGEYWIVDAEAECVEQHLLTDGRYGVTRLAGGDVIRSAVVPGFAVAVGAFFDTKQNSAALKALLSWG
jgi:Uma2 family endonuclease